MGEREIAVLNAILSQERSTILDREAEIGKLLVQNGGPKANGLSPPTRPTRKKSQVQSAAQRAPSRGSSVASPPAASPTDDESTMTFHDALSDDEDVLIADLEMDEEEEDDRRHRKSDIVDLDSIPLS